jgi:hypothetical protein
MDSTKSFIKVYNVTQEEAENFEFDYDTETSDIISQLVPNKDDYANLGWVEFEEYEYNPHSNTMHLTLETKWAAPTIWLQSASRDTHYFKDKLITMSTIQKDETCVTGVAVRDGEVLQNKHIFEMSSEEVGKYYNDDETGHDLDDLDNQIWDSVGHFMRVCEQFYLGKE